MTDPRRGPAARLVAGALLVLLGLASWALYAATSSGRPQAYSHGGQPRQYVRLVAGDTYRIAIPGGVQRAQALGVVVDKLRCTAARPGQAAAVLRMSAESTDTTAINDIASFVSPLTGPVHVECAGLGTVFVANAADARFDWSGVWLVLASAALLVGLPLVLSGLRAATTRPAAEEPADDEVVPA